MSDTKLNKHGLERFWDRVVAYISNAHVMIGDTPMGTVATTITGAIAEIVDALGNTTMGTTARTLTGAIKEHNDKIGNTTMGTTATTLTGAIAEHEGDISSLNSNLAKIQSGYGAILNVNNDTTVSVTFPTPYSTPPNVVVGFYKSSYNRRMHVSDITTTGFTVTGALLTGTTTANIEFQWIAFKN